MKSQIVIYQARHLHQNMPAALLGAFICAAWIVSLFWSGNTAPYLVGWFAATSLHVAWRALLWWRWRKELVDLQAAQRWLRHSIRAAAMAGLTWGAAWAWLFPSNDLTQQFFFVLMLYVLEGVAMFGYSVHYATYLAFLISFATLPWLALLRSQAPFHNELAFSVLLFSATIAWLARVYSRMHVDTLRLRFEKDDLIRQLTLQKDLAQAAVLAKSRFLAAASHDLRQPMHALGLYLDELQRIDLPAPAEDALTHANQCADAMNEMFVALLDVSLLDAGAVVPRIEVFSLGAMLQRLAVEFETQATAKDLTLRVAACAAWVRSDPTMLERILRNLLTNALRYTDTGTVLLGCRRRGTQLRVEVWDTGTGIAPEQQRVIFEEFYQVGNRARDRSKGLGLGLAIVEREARLLGLSVTLCSEVGRGSVFRISLPMAVADSPRDEAVPQLDGEGRSELRGRRILLIDDEPMIRHATQKMLEQWGCSVVTAASSQEAIALWSALAEIPELLICDYRLPGEDGGQAIQKIRTEFNEKIPALLVTGDTSSECLRQIQATGCPVLHKPIRADELQRELTALLGDAV